jgi:ubiquinone/menaquinone biosynthesis C-methylase UbiE
VFQQAAVISVVSDVVKDDVVARGIDPAKVLVNPNAVDIDAYAPARPEEKRLLRAELGLSDEDRVIGFIGTFGGWHGVDVLAAALPRICETASSAKFLMIGDGPEKHRVDGQVMRHGLGDRVRMTGSVPQTEGARLLRACDILVSPHKSHMVDSRFFGSPTKIFEYMALAGGIVASDLEQIGEVLSPGLRASKLEEAVPDVGEARAILCTPGSIDEFVDAVVFLCAQPELCAQLGANARRAAASEFTWNHHVAKLLKFATSRSPQEPPAPAPARPQVQAAMVGSSTGTPSVQLVDAGDKHRLTTGDAYKDEVQNQWDNNPCGSQYVKEAEAHTLEWFLEAERYRYVEYAPWMAETMEFSHHAGKELLEIGAGMGTDLAQFAKHGAIVTDVDLSSGHLALAKENFQLRGLQGRFVHQDAETLPFPDASFDVVYSNGVIHHTPNTQKVVDEIYRVLRPGGKAIIMVYAENSIYYWRNLVGWLGLKHGQLYTSSIGHVMSCSVEMTANDARPLVKAYSKPRIRRMFGRFERVTIDQRQLTAGEMPRLLKWMNLDLAGRLMGWNLIVKAHKPG